MISPIFTPDCFKILSLFSISSGSRFNRTEIKSRTKLNNVPLDKALLSLVNSLVLVRSGNYYGINFECEYSQKLLEICSKQYQQLRELPLEMYYLVIDLVTPLSQLKRNEAFLFGAYAKRVYTEKSKVDLAILYSKQPDKANINKLIMKLEGVYQKKVEVHYFEKKSFYKNKKNPLIKSILKDGVKLI